jgi:hypothetical protein
MNRVRVGVRGPHTAEKHSFGPRGLDGLADRGCVLSGSTRVRC